MILRRFMKHVTDQNWFAVGLDVIVVIVGIFLGLQVQAVYEERQNIAEERRLIDAMTIEVEELLAIRNAQLEELNTEQESVVEALAILFGEESTQKLTNKHCIGVRRSHSRSTAWNDIPITSVEEIVVSGKLNIIRNPELRAAILRLRSVSISVSSRIDLITSRDVILYSKFPELIQTKFNALHSGPLSGPNPDVVFCA
ncbi:MAG: hypothetical protein HOH19_13670 [Kordiimonadaceae bacterium]|jgi:hypothetical protein|nr:hypothetical protein [Kordiimonadaceae bacterium]MBT6033620.1 hypothetical protein [Kordiimonadaceae bacterium]